MRRWSRPVRVAGELRATPTCPWVRSVRSSRVPDRAQARAHRHLQWPYSISRGDLFRCYLRHKFVQQRRRIVLPPD